MVIAAKTELVPAIRHCDNFSNVATGANKTPQSSIEEFVNGTLKLHAARVSRQVLLETHLSDSNLFVNSDTIHIQFS